MKISKKTWLWLILAGGGAWWFLKGRHAAAAAASSPALISSSGGSYKVVDNRGDVANPGPFTLQAANAWIQGVWASNSADASHLWRAVPSAAVWNGSGWA